MHTEKRPPEYPHHTSPAVYKVVRPHTNRLVEIDEPKPAQVRQHSPDYAHRETPSWMRNPIPSEYKNPLKGEGIFGQLRVGTEFILDNKHRGRVLSFRKDGMEFELDGKKTYQPYEVIRQSNIIIHEKKVRELPNISFEEYINTPVSSTLRMTFKEELANILRHVYNDIPVRKSVQKPESWESYYAQQFMNWRYATFLQGEKTDVDELRRKAETSLKQAHDPNYILLDFLTRHHLDEMTGMDADDFLKILNQSKHQTPFDINLRLALENASARTMKEGTIIEGSLNIPPSRKTKDVKGVEGPRMIFERKVLSGMDLANVITDVLIHTIKSDRRTLVDEMQIIDNFEKRQKFESTKPTDDEKRTFDGQFLDELHRRYDEYLRQFPEEKKTIEILDYSIKESVDKYEEDVFKTKGIHTREYLELACRPLVFLSEEYLGNQAKVLSDKVRVGAYQVRGLWNASSVLLFPELYTNIKLSDKDFDQSQRYIDFLSSHLQTVLASRAYFLDFHRAIDMPLLKKSKILDNKLVVPQEMCGTTEKELPNEDLVMCFDGEKFVCSSLASIVDQLRDGVENPVSSEGKPFPPEFVEKVKKIYLVVKT